MVRIQGPSDYERLDEIVHRIAADHDLVLDITGWTRKTYTVVAPETKKRPRTVVARVESFATTNGEILVLHDDGLPFAEALAGELERAFPIEEAVIRRR